MGPGAPVPLSPLSLSHLEFLTLPSPGRRPSPHTRKETSLATLWWPAEQPCTMRRETQESWHPAQRVSEKNTLEGRKQPRGRQTQGDPSSSQM